MLGRLFAVVLAIFVLVGIHTSVASAATRDLIADGLWAGSNFDASGMTRRPTTPPPVPPISNPNAYAALGDSVAAGAGLPFATNATSADRRCARSSAAYPHQVAAATGKTLIHAACTGARAGDLFTRQGVRGPNIAPQLKKAFSTGVPGLITISAGANDVRWTTFLRKCYVRTCGTALDTRISDAYLTALELKFDYAMYEINYRSGNSPPKVILTGYYNPLSAACSTLEPRFTAAEITWFAGQLNSMNAILERIAARYSFVEYAPVDFTGHDICSADPWVQGPTTKAPFHPTATGQQVIGSAVLGKL